jgi:sugar O-acyltransferase (sialic acid O-acetyltransferase NeuD family)
MIRVLIIGAGGHGRVVLDIIRHCAGLVPAGFVDANPKLTGHIVDGADVLGTPEDIPLLATQHDIEAAIVAIGDNRTRAKYAAMCRRLGLELVSVVHPSATIADTASIGENVVIAAGVMVCAHCRIANSVILNTGCIIDHESMVGRGSHVCPGARLAGRVRVGRGAFVGIGATIIQNVSIGDASVVGAGAVVLKDVPARTLAVGVPARMIVRA